MLTVEPHSNREDAGSKQSHSILGHRNNELQINSSGLDCINAGSLESLQHILVLHFLQLSLQEWKVHELQRRTEVLAEDGQIEPDPKCVVLDEQRDAARDLGNLDRDGDPSAEISLELANLDGGEERNLDVGCDYGIECLLVDESTELRVGRVSGQSVPLAL